MIEGVPDPPSERGAVWTREELVMALRIAVSSDGIDPDRPSFAVVTLADLLSRAVLQGGRPSSPWTRCPRAVALKVLAIRRALVEPARLVRLGREAVSVIGQFEGRLDRLRAASVEAEALLEWRAAPSRGPVPSEGAFRVDRTADPSLVYALRLEGGATTLAAGTAEGRDLFKIGRSGDLRRRTAELNWGFPSTLGLRWVPFSASPMMTAEAAHALEQSLLVGIASRGWSVGGEFAMARVELIGELLVDAGLQTIMRPAAAARRAKVESVNPGGARQRRSRSAAAPRTPVGRASAVSLK
ncbi:hypothetical protein ASE78_07015 [Sphingomonas sp. Leaf25]|nr:hypothetical protein ASE78_07015 [Sphingomonas sp. Leaf25]